MTTKRRRLTAQLPPTPCTPDMRAAVINEAEKRGVSIADVQRQAFTLFLAQFDSNTIASVK